MNLIQWQVYANLSRTMNPDSIGELGTLISRLKVIMKDLMPRYNKIKGTIPRAPLVIRERLAYNRTSGFVANRSDRDHSSTSKATPARGRHGPAPQGDGRTAQPRQPPKGTLRPSRQQPGR